jgi:hypothetical protein
MNNNFSVVEFSDEAKDVWIKYSIDVERAMLPGGYYADFTDHASKLADNVTRVAGVLHGMNFGLEGEISLETLRQAINICAFYSRKFVETFSEPPQEEIDASKLSGWFQKKRMSNYRYIRKSFALTHGPIQKASRLDIAITVLANRGEIALLDFQKQNSNGRGFKITRVIDLIPSLPPNNYEIQVCLNT